MIPQEKKIQDKLFLIKTYSSLLQIEKMIWNIVQNNDLHPQLSILSSFAPDYSNEKNGFDKVIKEVRLKLTNMLGKPIQFGYFMNPEIGMLFIAGHLTETFLCKIDKKELGSLPIGLFGIFRGMGIDLKHIDRYLKEIQDGKFLLIIRDKKETITTIESLIRTKLH
jgi:hypothetical protein